MCADITLFTKKFNASRALSRGSRVNVVGIGTRLRAGRYWVRVSVGITDFSHLQKSRPALGPTQPHILRVRGFFCGDKAAWALRSSLTSAECRD